MMKKFIVFLTAMTCLFAMSWAQESTGNIFGKILLADGAALPGVTVTLTGDVYGKATAVSSAEGNYRFMKLSPGNYSLRFELEGFKVVVRSAVRVSVNSSMQLDVVMEPGTIQEQISVIGRTPVIDTRKVSVAANVTSDALRTLPISRNPVEIINMAPGILPPKPVVGGSSYGSWFAGFGTIGFKSEFNMDGGTYGSTNYPGEPPGNSWSINSERIEETKITTTGMDIHSVQGGVSVNFVSKRGGNRMSGAFYLNLIDGHWVSEKSYPADMLAAGYVKGGLLKNWKYGAAVGGPLLKDHVWYYVSYGLVDNYSQNMTNQRISRPLSFDVYAKGNFQLFGNTTGEFSYQKSKYEGKNVNFIHALELNGINEFRPTEVYSGQLNSTLGKLMLSAKFTYLNMFKQQICPGTEQWFTGTEYNPPRRFWIYDNFYSPNTYRDAQFAWVIYNDKQKRPYISAEANYFAEKLLGADHEMLLGFDIDKPQYIQGYFAPNQMFVYISPNVNGINVRSDPTKSYDSYFSTYASTIGPRTAERMGIYFQDIITWNRLAINVGVRYDRMRYKWDPVTIPGFAPEGNAISAWDQWLGSFDVAGGNTPYLNVFSPRISASYDLTGDGKNLIKASYANYGGALTNVEFRNGFKSGYNRGSFRIPFIDANGNLMPDAGEYPTTGITPDEIDRRYALGVAEQAAWNAAHPGVAAPASYFTYPGWNFYSFSGVRGGKNATSSAPTDFLADDFKPSRILELALGYEKMLSDNIGVSLIGSYKKEYNNTWARGYTGTPSNYTLIPVQNNVILGKDASGWDIYGLAPGTVIPPAAGYLITNYKKCYDDFYGLQLLFKKKLANHWMLDSSLSLTKWTNHRSLDEMPRDTLWDYYDKGLFSSANYASGQILANSTWSFKTTALYQLPYGMAISASIDGRQGYPYNVWVTRSAIGATLLPKFGSKYGDERMPDVWNLQAKFSKVFDISDTVKLDTYIIGYNILDAMTPLLYNYSEVPTLNKTIAVMDSRTFEVGVRFMF